MHRTRRDRYRLLLAALLAGLIATGLFPGLTPHAAAEPAYPSSPGADSGAASGRRFAFRLAEGDVLSVDKYQDIRVFENGVWSSREEKNRIVLTVRGRDERGALLEGQFLTYSRSPRLVGEFRREQNFDSRFVIQDNGRYLVPDQYIMPNLRSLPTFPDRPLQPGDEWEAPALETMDFGPMKLKLPMVAKYRYAGEASLQLRPDRAERFDRIEYRYSFNHPVQQPGSTILRITGFSTCELWFDREAGTPVFDANRLVYTFYLADGSVQRYLFRIDSWWRKSRRTTPEERGRIAGDIEENLEEESSLRVRQSEEGVVLELDNILFGHDSAELGPDARKQLAEVARILKAHPQREIRISGHTDATGGEAYNRELSERRARSVSRALAQEHDVDARRLSYRGYGEAKPVADNSTPEGRSRNRRVEVLIVTD